MYTNAGFMPSQLGDIDVVEDDSGRLHLFHLTLPNHDIVAHLISDDGLSWQRLPNALCVGNPGECDDDMIWTMHVKKFGEQYVMLYTALSHNEGGKIQRVAKAISDDLIHWTKSSDNPPIEADPRWYESTPAEIGFASWRDPYMFAENGEVYTLISARTDAGPVSRRGCIGWMKASDDNLEKWEVLPPLFAPHQWYDMEVPVIFRHDDKYVLICSCNTHAESKVFYWLADSLEGPYYNPGNNQMLPGGNYAVKVIYWRGEWLLFGWYGGKFDWLPGCDYVGKVLLPPKKIAFNPNGTMYLSIFDGWEKYFVGTPEVLQTMQPNSVENSPAADWQLQNGKLIASCSSGQDVVLWDCDYADFMLTCNIRLPETNSVGIVFRSDENVGVAYELEFDVSSQTVRLGFRDAALQRTPWRIIKESRVYLTPCEEIEICLLVVEENIEMAVNGKEIISAMSKIRNDGAIGISIKGARAVFNEFCVQRIAPPRNP